MRIFFVFIFLFACLNLLAQESLHKPITNISVGSIAPEIKVKKWLKGNPTFNFSKGEIYVIEFWATWCLPCINYMPHLSSLANKYKNEVTFIGVSIYEEPKTSIEEIESFVDSMGDKMDYNVAIDSSNYMAINWMSKLISRSIPKLFIINSDGIISWIGHPKDVDHALQKIVNNEYDLDVEFRRLKELEYIDSVGREFSYSMLDFQYKDIADSVIIEINRRILIEPKLENSYYVGYLLFEKLLQTDQGKALHYGEKILNLGETSLYRVVYENILYNRNLKINPEIYSLASDLYSLYLNDNVGFQYKDLYEAYSKIADWYWRGREREKAIVAQKEAIYYNRQYFNKEILRLQKKLNNYETSSLYNN